MCFEVGALCVSFPTANIVTRVRGDSLPRPGAPPAFRFWFLRQAVPTGDHEGLCGVQRNKDHCTLSKIMYIEKGFLCVYKSEIPQLNEVIYSGRSGKEIYRRYRSWFFCHQFRDTIKTAVFFENDINILDETQPVSKDLLVLKYEKTDFQQSIKH